MDLGKSCFDMKKQSNIEFNARTVKITPHTQLKTSRTGGKIHLKILSKSKAKQHIESIQNKVNAIDQETFFTETSRSTTKGQVIATPQTNNEIQVKVAVAPKAVSISNYPNPFNPVTTITMELPKNSQVRVEIYDILGRKVATLVDTQLSSGEHRFFWDGGQYAAGTYFARMVSVGENGQLIHKTIKLLLLK